MTAILVSLGNAGIRDQWSGISRRHLKKKNSFSKTFESWQLMKINVSIFFAVLLFRYIRFWTGKWTGRLGIRTILWYRCWTIYNRTFSLFIFFFIRLKSIYLYAHMNIIRIVSWSKQLTDQLNRQSKRRREKESEM